MSASCVQATREEKKTLWAKTNKRSARRAIQGLAHPETNGPSLKNQPLHLTYIFVPGHLPILSYRIEPQEGDLLLS